MNRIAILRKERKLSQKELGAIIGVAQNTICNWENGKREPDYDSLKKMAFFFNCSTDYLLGQTSFGKTFVFDEETDPNLDWAGHPLAGKDKEKKPIPVFEDGLDDEQKELIRLFETAPAAFRAAALALLRSAEAQSEVQGEVSKAE